MWMFKGNKRRHRDNEWHQEYKQDILVYAIIAWKQREGTAAVGWQKY